jgi:hypothetical protein
MSRSDNAKVAVGFSPRTAVYERARRGATLERGGDFKRGYATQAFAFSDRGLKPTATIARSLREQLAACSPRLCV